MLCVRCKKRPAIVFVQKLEAGEAKSEGYCLSCARELGIKPVDDIMKQFGISDQDLEAMEERFAGMMENGRYGPRRHDAAAWDDGAARRCGRG